MPQEEHDSRYWAFISYSTRDEKIAAWLHRSLESFRLPRGLAGKAGRDGILLPRRLIPIFRDREELPSSSDLAHSVTAALKRSRCLIVLCSPRSAVSKWVNQEVETFKQLGREDAIFSVILDGEPNADAKPELGEPECFPIALRHPLGTDGALDLTKRTDPLSADLRPGKDGRSKAFLKVVAGLAGVPFDALRRRARARRRMRFIQLATAAVAAMAAMAWTWHWLELRKRNELDAATASNSISKANAAMNAGDAPSQVALLAFALRHAPSNSLIVTRLVLALQQHNWPRPEAVIPGEMVTISEDLIVVRDEKGYRAWSWRKPKPEPAGPVLPVPGLMDSYSVSPDGRLAWFFAGGKEVLLYSTLTGAELAPPIAIQKANSIGFERFTPDSRRIVTWEQLGPFIRDSTTGRVLIGPLDYVRNAGGVLFSSDGSRLSLSDLTDTDTSRIFETATGRPVTPLRKGKILAINADGSRFVALACVGTVSTVCNSSLWEVDQNEPLASLAEPGYKLQAASFNPKGPELVVTENRNRAAVWTTEPIVDTEIIWNEKTEVQDVAFAPEGSRVLLVFDEHVQLRHLSSFPSYPPISTMLRGSGGYPSTHRFSPGGEFLAVALQGEVCIWNTGPSAAFAEPLSLRKMYVSVGLAAAGRLVASTQDGWIVIADSTSGKLVGEPIVGEFRPDVVEISPNGELGLAIYRVGADRTKGFVFDVKTGKVLHEKNWDASERMSSACFSGDNTVLVQMGAALVPFFATSGAQAGAELTFTAKEPRRVTACARDGKVAVGFGDGTVDLVEAGRSVRTITPPAKAIGIDELLFTADGKLLMIRWGGSLVLWDLTSGAERFRATVQCGSLCPTAISQDASIIAIADDKKVLVWDTRTKALLESPLEHPSAVTAIALSRDGQRLFTATVTGAVRQWATANGDTLGQTLELNGRVSSMALTEDEQLLLIATQTGPLMIWETGKIRDDGLGGTQSYRDDSARLADCAEAVAGLTWAPDANAFKQIPIAERQRRLAVISSEVQTASANESGLRKFLRWLTSDPQRRSISPNRSTTLKDLTEARLLDGSPRALQEAAFLSLGREKGGR